VPLILLTADRPARLRDLGANQTTNQVGIFADAVRAVIDVSPPELNQFDPLELARQSIDLSLGALGSRPGPVQLNLQFQEPLSAAFPNAADIQAQSFEAKSPAQRSELEVEIQPTAVVIAGHGAGKDAELFASEANLPLFAEPSSGARFGSQVVVDYPIKLKSALADEVTQAFVFGKPTLSRSVIRLLSKVQVWVQNSSMGKFNVHQNALGFADRLVPVGKAESSWLATWQQNQAKPSRRGELAQLIWSNTNDEEQLLFGASQIIREAEWSLEPKKVKVFSNRGLAGIDGTIATAIGLAQTGHKTRALIGDLTFLHDASSMNLSGIGEINLQLFVGNDGGGEIFKSLEVASSISEAELTKLFLTPQRVDIESLAKAYGWNYARVSDLDELSNLLSASGCWILDYQL
jgi:2-succinyl-5-enolpyruvyl-6-hydroxy-3-cyclohexene-1-carboxylate synthase